MRRVLKEVQEPQHVPVPAAALQLHFPVHLTIRSRYAVRCGNTGGKHELHSLRSVAEDQRLNAVVFLGWFTADSPNCLLLLERSVSTVARLP